MRYLSKWSGWWQRAEKIPCPPFFLDIHRGVLLNLDLLGKSVLVFKWVRCAVFHGSSFLSSAFVRPL
jgi:hypothetical protein